MGLVQHTTLECDVCGATHPEIVDRYDVSERPPKGWVTVRVFGGTHDAWFCPEHAKWIRLAEAKIDPARKRARDAEQSE